MTSRICPKPGCPNFIPIGAKRCKTCQAAWDKARGSNTERGYTAEHFRRGAKAKAEATRKKLRCELCSKPMLPGQELHFDHETPLAVDRSSRASRVLHASCNASAGGRLAHNLPPKPGGPDGQPPRAGSTAP